MTTRQVLQLDALAKKRLYHAVQMRPPIFNYADDPALASLCTCLGLQFEVGNQDFDRLSPYFGVELSQELGNPWVSEIFTQGHEIGICFKRADGAPLVVRHADFRFILAPESLDRDGNLKQIVIYPARVAQTYKTKGFDLVIVRDWLLNCALNQEPAKVVPYLLANQWEVESNIARTQAMLMLGRKLAFFGTHDIVDHLLDADYRRYDVMQPIFADVAAVYDDVFDDDHTPTKEQLCLSYLIGVVLDDLAQPKRYGSSLHKTVLNYALRALAECSDIETNDSTLVVPSEYTQVVAAMRGEGGDEDIIHKFFKTNYERRKSTCNTVSC